MWVQSGRADSAMLYSTLYSHVLARPEVAELTVEDPAEAFEDLRDRNDLRHLVADGIEQDPKFLDGVGVSARGPRAKWEAEKRKGYKIAQVGWTTDGLTAAAIRPVVGDAVAQAAGRQG
jgi:hypothetical protein